MKGRNGKPAAGRESATDRREQIAAALDACIRKSGYAESSLTDIANAAEMSPSHVHYYFEGKLAILEYHFETLLEGLLEEVLPLQEKPPVERIEGLVSFMFDSPKTSEDASGVYFEIFGVAVHNEKIRAAKNRWDAEMRRFFVELYQETPRASGLSPAMAAEIGFALLIGVGTNAFFDKDQTPGRAREIFRSELLRLAGWPFETRPEETQ